jgi:hypothetical protein
MQVLEVKFKFNTAVVTPKRVSALEAGAPARMDG